MVRDDTPRIDLPPDPVIEVYKKHVDRTLLRENLKLTIEQRLIKLQESMDAMESSPRALEKGTLARTQPGLLERIATLVGWTRK